MLTTALKLLFVFVLVVASVEPDPEATCSEFDHCGACAKASSWISNCRWCPTDQRCHAFGSLLNPCHANQNIKNPEYCPAPGNYTTKYNQKMAYNMLRFAKASYDDKPQNSTFLPAGCVVLDTWEAPIVGGSAFGYAAVDRQNEQIILAFRGSTDYKQIMEQILNAGGEDYPSRPGFPAPPGVKVLKYFLIAWQSLATNIEQSLAKAVAAYPKYTVYVTGHSLGGALASLTSFDLAHRKIVPNPYVYTFGEPRTGNIAYAELHNSLVKHNYRVVNNRDPIPHVPLCLPVRDQTEKKCEFTMFGWTPWHTTTEIFYDKGEYKNGVMCVYRECTRQPTGEDHACSDGFINIPAGALLPGLGVAERIALLIDWGLDLTHEHSAYWDLIEDGFCGVVPS